jgi:hypothetical protein
MNAVRVQYTVRPDFAEQNATNIRAVMEELAASGETGIQYTAFRIEDGNTFVHIVVMEDESKGSVIPSLPAFQIFRAALKGAAVSPPVNDPWAVVGTSYSL